MGQDHLTLKPQFNHEEHEGPPIISELPQGSCGALAALLQKCRVGIHFSVR